MAIVENLNIANAIKIILCEKFEEPERCLDLYGLNLV